MNKNAKIALSCAGLTICGLISLLVLTLGGFGALFALGSSAPTAQVARVTSIPETETPTSLPEPTATPVQEAELVDNLPIQSTVQIWAMMNDNGRLTETWSGSGSIITEDGLILTNAHVVLPEIHFPVDALRISLTHSADELPIPTYFAEVLQADIELDLAVLRITNLLNGDPVQPDTLNLPFV